MKKTLLVLMLCMVSIMSFGQKAFYSETFVTEIVDEFGDKTDNMRVGIKATGYFSNSVASNSRAELIISAMKNTSWYDFYEYCGYHSSNESFNIKFIGTTTHTSVSINYHSIPYNFFELCKDNDTIYVTMKATDSYIKTTAVFKLFGCKKFYKKYIETFGDLEFVTFERTENTLYIYEHPFLKSGFTMALPQIRCVKLQSPLQYKYHIGLSGIFSNGASLQLESKNITIDNTPAKVDEFGYFDFDWFLTNMHSGSIIRIEYAKDPSIYEEFKITEDQYNALIGFFNN